jgi:two-component system, sensor histidine kinase and response regulator
MDRRSLFYSNSIILFFVSVLLIQPLVYGISVQNRYNVQDIERQTADRDTTYVRELNEKALELLENGQMNPAKPLIEEAFRLAGLLSDLEGEAFAASNLGNYYLNRGLPDSALSSLEHDFEKYENTAKEIQIGNTLANAHNMLGNYQQGLELYKKMYNLAAERNETRMMIGITQNIGLNYQSLGDIPAALDHYLSSLEMAEERKDTLIMAVVLDNIATINTNEGNFEIAEHHLMRALEMNKQINNRGNQITNHMSLGGLYRQTGEYDKAKQNYDRVLELAETLGNNLSYMQALYNLGMLNIDMEEYNRAMDFFDESLELSIENNITIGSYYNHSGKADVYRKLGDYGMAIELYKDALEIAENAGGAELVRATLQKLYETSESAGDTLSAYHYVRRFSAITDSLSRTEREEALARQESILGLRAERENLELLEKAMEAQRMNTLIVTTLLGGIFIVLIAVMVLYRKKRKANLLLQKKTEELTEVNLVKDKLLSVLAHDLRTPLSNMQGVVYMIRENILNKEDIDNALNQIDFQLQQGINTLTNYLEWAQSHKDGIEADVQEVPIDLLVDNAVHEISNSAENKGVYIQKNTGNNITALADPHMMRVVLRNLLSNAVKYVEAGDRITVSAKEINSHLELSIQDTGQGIPVEKQDEIFRPFHIATKGTMGETGTGLGLSICKEFIEKQGGDIQVESKPGKGTTFTIRLKKSAIKKASKASV